MKTLSIITAALAIALTPAMAGEDYSYQVTGEEVTQSSLFDVSLYGTYRHELSGDLLNSDDFGAGISLLFPLANSGLSPELSYEWREGSASDVHAFGLHLRYDFLELGALTVYGRGGGAYLFTGSEDAWALDAGAGLSLALTDRLSLFSDWSYRWDVDGGNGDTGGARLGASFSF